MPPTYKRKKNTESQSIPDIPKLTSKQLRFANAILEGKRPHEAYIYAYSVTSQNRVSIYATAHKLLHNPQIAQFIRYFQRVGLVESQVNRENHLAELARLRELAIDNTQISAGVQAEHYRGRIAGLYNDKISLSIGPSDEALLSQIASLLGGDFAKSLAKSMGYEDGETIELDASLDSEMLKLPSPVEND